MIKEGDNMAECYADPTKAKEVLDLVKAKKL